MLIQVRYFASLRERLRLRAEEVDIVAGATVGDLWKELLRAHPALADAGASLRFAVNQEYVEGEHPLADGDEVALIPPVSGGV